MNAAAVMAVVLFLFFLVGVAVGVLVVIAVSARRAHKAASHVAPPPHTWPYQSGPGPDEGGPDEPTWWQARSGD
jgi:hypothetical protein